MIAQRHLDRAPIKEAIIDIQVSLPDETEVNSLNSIYDSFSEEYPIHNTLRESTFGVKPNEGEPTSPTLDHTIKGFRYQSADQTKIIQFRTNGYTFSRLEPYTTWEEMRAEARHYWEKYSELASPQVITRVATRFINVMNVPRTEEILDFDDYLTAGPQLPDNMPQAISSFLTRIVVPYHELNVTSIITQALESKEPEYAPIVLDIDVFSGKHFEAVNDEIWGLLDSLREIKNSIFFESITEKTAELFS